MEITKERLEQIYRANTNVRAAEILNVSVPTLLKKLKSVGIKLKGKRGKRGGKLIVI